MWRYKSNGSGGYTPPKGLFLGLSRNDRGWLLVDQKGRMTGFDNLGRIAFEADEFATNPYAVDDGNVVRYLYGADGLVQTIIDPVGRESKLAYLNDRLRTVEDKRGRVVTYDHDALGRLWNVMFPPVANADGVKSTLGYLDGGSAPWYARGSLESVDRAGITRIFKYPTPTAEPERNVKTTTELDTWLRPKNVVTTGPQLQLHEEIAYDANGRLKTAKRQLDINQITETFEYDTVGRMKIIEVRWRGGRRESEYRLGDEGRL